MKSTTEIKSKENYFVFFPVFSDFHLLIYTYQFFLNFDTRHQLLLRVLFHVWPTQQY